jgi:hypothetical protein
MLGSILESLKAIEERLTTMERETETESDTPLTPAETEILAGLRAIEARMTAIEAAIGERSAPANEVHQALQDVLKIYMLTGQIAEVASSQRDQIQALAEAYERLSIALTTHDGVSTADRADIKELMVQLRELARAHVRNLTDIARAVGVDDLPSEKKQRQRDVRPEEDGHNG